VKAQTSKNEWLVRHARRVLQERGPKPEVHQALIAMVGDKKLDVPQRLRALWALHVTKGLTEKHSIELLRGDEPWLKAWTIQFACEDKQPSGEMMTRFNFLAKNEQSAVVRLYLACAAQRIAVKDRADLVTGLLGHPEDESDHNLPMMDWYATEPVIAADLKKGTELLGQCKIPRVQEFIAPRIASLAK